MKILVLVVSILVVASLSFAAVDKKVEVPKSVGKAVQKQPSSAKKVVKKAKKVKKVEAPKVEVLNQ